MGGLEMLCLGYRRGMPDLQIAYDDKDFHRIKAKLESDQRVRLPEGINSLFPARLLVRTGPAFKDKDCRHSGDIEVDIIPPGSHGTPPSGELAKNIVLLSLKTDGKLKTYKGLNMLHLVKTLVMFCRVADLVWDPRKDILFLCQHYGEQVEPIRSQLDQKAIKQNFLGTPFFSRLSPEDQRKCYQVLLGTEPPPIMAITPPAPSSHKYSASAPDVSGPRSKFHNSSSSLSSDRSRERMSPAISSKPKPPHTNRTNAERTISQTNCSDSSAATRESRSRYRVVSAASSQEISPIVAQITTSTHVRQHSQPPPIAHSMSPKNTNHNTSHSLHLQPHLTFSTATQGTKSMPNLNGGLCSPAPSYAFTQMPPSIAFGRLPQLSQSNVFPVEMAASPVTLSPGQQHMQSKAAPAADGPQHRTMDNISMMNRPRPQRNKLTREEPVSEISVMDRPRPPRTRSPAKESVRAELSGIPMPEQQVRYLHVVNPDVTEPVHNNHIAGNQQTLSPVELDAMSELKQFIAELSVQRSTPAPQSISPDVTGNFVETKATPQPTSASSVSEPEPSLPYQYDDITIRPLKTRTISASISTLPTSLRPGGLASHTRTNSACSGNLPTTGTILHFTNASKYTNLTAPSTPPPSLPSSPQPTYIAYNPASTSTLPPFMPLSPPGSIASTSVSVSALSDKAESLYSPESPELPERQGRFSRLIDVDGAGEYFKDKHRRDKSADTRALAMEYQAELPAFGEGYWKMSLDFEGDAVKPQVA